MCACAVEEITLSIPMNILGCSIFCYFLLHVLKEHQPKGKFALYKDMDEIAELSQSFSSLLMCYSSERGGLLKPTLLQPEVYSSKNDDVNFCDEFDGSNDSHWLNKLISLYDAQACKPSLHPVAQQWLQSKVVQESLKLLLSVDSLPELYNGILCAMFYSVACIHLACDPTHLSERNFFITVAISISAIGYVNSDLSITEEQLRLGLKFYYLPINSVGIPTGSIEKLFMELHVQYSNNTIAIGHTVDQNTVSNTGGNIL